MLYLHITLMLSTTEIDLKLNTPRENLKKNICPVRNAENPLFRDK